MRFTYRDSDTVGTEITKTQNARTVGNDDNLNLNESKRRF